MIVDIILDRKDAEEWNEPYDPRKFYREIFAWHDLMPCHAEKITAAMDYGTDDDVRAALCEYIIKQDYNKDICDYINSRTWIN